MIRRSRAQSSSLFLMELILAILFFSITSAVCVQFFVKSHLLSRESKALAQAVNECTNIAEIFDASESTEDAVSLLKANFPDLSAGAEADEAGGLSPAAGGKALAAMYYDDTFSPCKKEDASYTLTASLSEANRMQTAEIRVTDSDGSVIYELNTSHHNARRTDDEER